MCLGSRVTTSKLLAVSGLGRRRGSTPAPQPPPETFPVPPLPVPTGQATRPREGTDLPAVTSKPATTQASRLPLLRAPGSETLLRNPAPSGLLPLPLQTRPRAEAGESWPGREQQGLEANSPSSLEAVRTRLSGPGVCAHPLRVARTAVWASPMEDQVRSPASASHLPGSCHHCSSTHTCAPHTCPHA